ncbi:MAG: UDP-2,3-diacylglucosamine diphosphatase [Casimicrobiaceae bacterium]|nr:UDP-2,3-diacylglucosamine diphosphatase [Casimicrobiaceae bacterium]MCX8097759.1 UDP-2,3-diacylglucosamine diphosphatase [Casimicrobiaceae bacterium]MDW8312727.1 UDP-2,3-diacylglucosamine diphosphatase [Burkholderiales bacterium]
MRVAFISDLHLSAADPSTDARFRGFLAGPARELDHLYVLGDLFDYWLGDDQLDWDAYARSVAGDFAALAATGVKLHLLRGNRDFLLGERFAAAARMELLPERITIDLGHERVLLLHGDELCTDDRRYQRLRPILRSRLFAAFVATLPKGARQRLAETMRARSERYKARTGQTALHILDAHPTAIARAMREARVRCLIHGHTHRPGRFEVPGIGERHVLTDWQQPRALLAWNATSGFHALPEASL